MEILKSMLAKIIQRWQILPKMETLKPMLAKINYEQRWPITAKIATFIHLSIADLSIKQDYLA